MSTSTTTIAIPEMIEQENGYYVIDNHPFRAGGNWERPGYAGMPCADSEPCSWPGAGRTFWTFGPGLEVKGEGQGRRVVGGKGWAIRRRRGVDGSDVTIYWFRIELADQLEVAKNDLQLARRRLDDARSAVESAKDDWTVSGPVFDALRKAEADARIDVGTAELELGFLETRQRQEEEALAASEE